MFDWKAKLIPAKFRGVEFSIVSSSASAGRRNVIHEYPFQDTPFAEDLGKAANTYNVEGYIIQKPPFFNYFKDRDALIAALNQAGPGQLDHPYLGKKQVVLSSPASITESVSEGGIARFSMTFTEAGEKKYPVAKVSIPAVDSSAWDAINAAIDTIGDAWDTAQNRIDDITSGMQQLQSAALAIRSLPSGVVSRAIGLVSQADALVGTVLSSPCLMAQAIVGGFDGLQFAAGMLEDTFVRGITAGCSVTGGSATTADGVQERETTNPDEDVPTDQMNNAQATGMVSAALKVTTFGESQGNTNGNVGQIVVTSGNTAQAKANQQMLISLFRTTALANACMFAVRGTYDSYEEAKKILDQIVARLDAFIEYLGDEAGSTTLANQGVNYTNDNTYSEVKALKPVFVKAMQDLGATLSKSKEYAAPPDTMSTLLLAYNEYGDLNRASEIRKRNPLKILHPGFIPGGETISILAE